MPGDTTEEALKAPDSSRQRATACAVLGMLICTGSLFLTWDLQPLPGGQYLALPGALYKSAASVGSTRAVNGFALGVHLPVTVCAVTIAALMLWGDAKTVTSNFVVVLQIVLVAVLITWPARSLVHYGNGVVAGPFVALIGAVFSAYAVFEAIVARSNSLPGTDGSRPGL